MRLAIWFGLIGLFAAATLADEPRGTVPSQDPKALPPASPIFLDSPADLEAFWKQIEHPDFVILSGEAYRNLRGEPAPATGPASATRASLMAVAVMGEVVGEQARLSVEFRVAVEGEGSTWVPVGLVGLPLATVREGGRDLGARMVEGRGWEVELAGKGEHPIRVDLGAGIATTADGRRIDLILPPSASTRVDLVVRRPVLDASTGPGEPVVVESTDAGGGSRLAARLGPRPRLTLNWRERNDPATELPALLSARGEVAIDVVAGSVRTRETWTIETVRGAATQVTFGIEPGEEVIDVEVAGLPVTIAARREDGRASVAVPLGQPLAAGSTRRVVLTTSRPIASEGPARVSLHGHPIEQARVQTGMMAIARSGPLFLRSTAGRGLRRVDPRTGLSETLRARPETVLAFEFSEQPFELNLAIEPAPPLIRVASRSTVTLGRQSARIDATLRYQVGQGPAFEVQVGLPRGLDFREAGPADLISSTQVVPADSSVKAPPGTSIDRVLSIRLSRLASTAETFTLNLRGSAVTDGLGSISIPLFEARADHFETGWAAVVSPRTLSVAPPEPAPGRSPYLADWGTPPADWSWPISGAPPADSGVLWLRGEGETRPVPLILSARARSIRHESNLSAEVDRDGVDVVDEIAGEVTSGSLARIDMTIPPDVPERWEVEGLSVTARDPIGEDDDGSRRYRLTPAQEIADRFRFRIRYRKPFPTPATPRQPVELKIAPIRMSEGVSTGRTLRISAAPAIAIEAGGEGWVKRDRPPSGSLTDPEASARVILASLGARPGSVALKVTADDPAPMPEVVASRLWIRTTQRPDFDLAMSAYYSVEARDGSIEVRLPAGSGLIRASVGEVELKGDGVDHLGPDRYRVRFPGPRALGPVVVGVEFIVPAAAVGSSWPGPSLANGSVMQTIWEVRLSGQRAGIGIPPGWTDENEWYWDGLLWRRKPARTSTELAGWLTGGPGRFRVREPMEPGDPGDRHGYLFSRSGPPTPLRFAIYSRSLLVLICSGPPLLIGLLVLARKPPARSVWAALMLLVFGVAAFCDPSTILLVGQSSVLGGLLLALAAVMNRAMERRGGFRIEPTLVPGSGPVEVQSSLVVSPSLGSDDTTAIRPRPGNAGISTAEHAIIVANPDRLIEGSSTKDFRRR